jgi:N-acetylglucosamine-6-phosphate deacetylase
MEKNPNSGVLGIHLEGPFLNPIKKGAHLEAYIIKPTKENIDLLLSEGKDIIKMWTIAPEMFDQTTLDYLISTGVTLSIGHSNATYEEAIQAMDKGIHLVTHLYNAMSPMNHRAPGLVGAALNHPNVTCQIILDGLHCHESAAEIALKIKNDKVILVSDALFLGRKKQSFQWDNFNATLTKGTYYNTDGNLAGSAISQLDAILFAVNNLHISPEKALRMSSVIPLQKLNILDQLWDIKIGHEVGFVGFDGEWGFEYFKPSLRNILSLPLS